MAAAAEGRRFLVHPAGHRGEGHVVRDAVGFEDAALTFVERWSPAVDEDDQVALIVCDCETGREQCFRVDLGSGEAEPCA